MNKNNVCSDKYALLIAMIVCASLCSQACSRRQTANNEVDIDAEFGLTRAAQRQIDQDGISILLDPNLSGGIAQIFSSILHIFKTNHPVFEWQPPAGQVNPNGHLDEVALGTQNFRLTDRFRQIFGGTDSRNVLRYIDDRVNYIYGLDDSRDQNSSSVHSFNNMGGAWYLDQLKRAPLQPYLTSGQLELPLPLTPRTGVMTWNSYGSRYYFDVIGSQLHIPTVDRAAMIGTTMMISLVHEARHSDCPHPIRGTDFENFINDRYSAIPPENQSCAFGHDRCYEGPNANLGVGNCDSSYWGPFSVQFVFAASLVKYGTMEMCDLPGFSTPGRAAECREVAKQVAMTLAGEAFSRLNRNVIVRQFFPRNNLSVDPEMVSEPVDLTLFNNGLRPFVQGRFGFIRNLFQQKTRPLRDDLRAVFR